MPHSPDRLEWTNEIPRLSDLCDWPGEPGCEYLYCDSEHEFEAQQQAGWKRIDGSPVFRLTGPAGSCNFVMMRRGERVKDLSLGPAQPLVMSDHLRRATGLDLPPQPKQPPAPRKQAEMAA